MKNLPATLALAILLFFSINERITAQFKHYHFEQAKDMAWGSRWGQVYQIPNDSVYDIVLRNKKLSPDADWLQTPCIKTDITQFDSLLATPKLAAGYYVMIYAEQNRVNYQFRRKSGINAALIRLHNKTFIEVKDAAGDIIPDATINYSGKKIAYNELLKAYPLSIKRKGMLTIRKGNDIIFFNSYAGRISNMASSLGSANDRYSGHYSGYYPNYISYKGYLVTNKPNYLPGDTVKYKAYLLNGATSEPVTEPLDVFVEGADKTSFMHSTISQGSGVYFSEFILGDSILPDQQYSLMIRGKESQAYFRQAFKIEDYLLDDSYLRVNTENLGTYQKGDSIHLYAYAYNANGLPLIDAALDLYIRSGKIKFKKNNPDVFIPDTLLHRRFDVAEDGDTYISFATDSLPNIDAMELLVTVRLKNANNEIKDTTFILNYNNNKNYLRISEQKDTVKAELISNKQGSAGKGFYHRNGIFQDSITYPFSRQIHYNDLNYTFFETDDTGAVLSSLPYTINNDQIQIREDYFKDTAYFHIINPQKIWMRYAVYEGNKLLYYGQTDKDTSLKQQSKRYHTFTLIASYNWQNRAMIKEAKAYKIKTKMLIGINKNDLVYPGQKDSVHIALKDPDDKGIAHTNVTVLAFNSKFKEDFTARLESSGYLKPGLDQQKRYSGIREQAGHRAYMTANMNAKWSALLGLDTSFFYRNIYRDTSDMLLYTFSTGDTQYAQVAVYVKEQDKYVQPDYISFDNQLAYIRIASIGTDPDALRAGETIKQVSFRSASGIYQVNNIQLKKGTKTNIFINGDSVSYNRPYSSALQVYKIKEQDSLNYFERQALANALFYYKSEYVIPFIVQQKERLFVSDKSTDQFNQLSGFRKQTAHQLYAVGPVNGRDSILFFQQGNVKTTFIPELNFSYSLRPGMMRMLQDTQSPAQKYNYKLPPYPINPGFNRTYRAIVSTDTLNIITDDDLFPQPNYTINYVLNKDSGTAVYIYPDGNLTLLTPPKSQVKSFILAPENSNKQPQIFNGLFEGDVSFKADTGNYTLWVIWADSGMSRIPELVIKAKGRNIYNLDIKREKLDLHSFPKDLSSFYTAINKDVTPGDLGPGRRIKGLVTDSQGDLLAGAIIFISGTGVGVATDENGLFSLDVPLNNQNITVDYYGCIPQKIELDGRSTYLITLALNKDTDALESVSVYGQRADRRSYTGQSASVSSSQIRPRPVTSVAEALSGSVPGVHITTGSGQPGSRPDILLRGMGSLSAGSTAQAETNTGNKRIKRENFLQSQQAQDFITGFMEDMQAASGIRSDFRDWAIWEPNLWTDKEGKVSFEANYPGTATSWKTYVLAMNPKGFAASVLSVTRSFKPLSATLSLPRFLRYGDSVQAVGNVINYTGTPFRLKTRFSSPDTVQFSELVEVKAGKTAQLTLAAPANNTVDTGSLAASFLLETANGYRDGEEKTIPVLPVGLTERKGLFTALSNDTSFSTRPDTYGKAYFTGKTTISIDGSLLDVMMQEIENLKAYPHGCTEQITSQLLSIHYEEVLKQLKGRKDFNNTRTKRVIINKLAAAQNRDGSFGWFADNSGDIRVSNYVLNALSQVNKDGILSQTIKDGYKFLQHNLAGMDTLNRIASLATLSAARQKAEYAFYLAAINTSGLDHYNQFALLKIKKEQGFDYKNELDTLLKKANINEKGLSWGKDSYDWYRNQLATTLLAYQLIENDTAYTSIKKQIIDYLLLKRNKGHYRNTAESGLVLSTLLPGLMQEQQTGRKQALKTKIRISGSYEAVIDSFPKRIVLNDKPVQLNIQKEGLAPAYLSVNYEFFNPDATAKDGTFKVSSTFKDNGGTALEHLKQGAAIKLIVKVEAIKDAEYVLIDVPLPAGCVPLPKSKTNSFEASRANFRDKTSIYCTTLPKGVHYFEIEVQARFKGTFNLSPASAAMMYFPDEQGNTEVKRIEIR